MKYKLKTNKKYLKIAGIVVLLLALPITLILVKQIQETRTSAATADKLEAEAGTLSSTGVSKQDENGASGGQYVLFQTTASAPTPTPGQGGIGPIGHVGPRYDFYDGKPGGNFPTLGVLKSWGQSTSDQTLYTGSPVNWQAENVYIVPNWVAQAQDVAAAMTQWLSSLPDGVSAESPTFVIFDRSQNGENSTGYGNGTEYILNRQIYIGEWGRLRRNIVLWGYNSRLKFTTSTIQEWPPGLLSFSWGGFDSLHVLGFEISGPSADWSWEPTYNPDIRNGPSSELTAGGVIGSWRKLRVLDNYIHHVAGMFDLREWTINSGPNVADWSYNDDAELAWNRAYWSMNQSMVIQQGWNIHIHNNDISDSRQTNVDVEEPNSNPSPPASRNVNWTFRNNRFSKWGWQPPDLNTTAMAMDAWHMAPSGQVTYENWKFLNNDFVYGYAQSGHPDYDSTLGCQPLWNAHLPVALQLYGGLNVGVTDRVGLIIQGNVSHLDQPIVDVGHHVGHCFNYTWGEIQDWRNITVTDNDFQDMDWRVRNVSNMTWERNGTSEAVPF